MNLIQSLPKSVKLSVKMNVTYIICPAREMWDTDTQVWLQSWEKKMVVSLAIMDVFFMPTIEKYIRHYFRENSVHATDCGQPQGITSVNYSYMKT